MRSSSVPYPDAHKDCSRFGESGRCGSNRVQSIDCRAYHSRRVASLTFSISRTTCPHGNRATTCCTNARSGWVSASARVYLRFRADPSIHGAGSDNRRFEDQGARPPLCSFAAANLASRRDYWRERPGDHSHPGFAFQRSIFGPHNTATPRPLNAIPCPLKL